MTDRALLLVEQGNSGELIRFTSAHMDLNDDETHPTPEEGRKLISLLIQLQKVVWDLDQIVNSSQFLSGRCLINKAVLSDLFELWVKATFKESGCE
jgi:hypothetical protein